MEYLRDGAIDDQVSVARVSVGAAGSVHRAPLSDPQVVWTPQATGKVFSVGHLSQTSPTSSNRAWNHHHTRRPLSDLLAICSAQATG